MIRGVQFIVKIEQMANFSEISLLLPINGILNKFQYIELIEIQINYHFCLAFPLLWYTYDSTVSYALQLQQCLSFKNENLNISYRISLNIFDEKLLGKINSISTQIIINVFTHTSKGQTMYPN